MTNTNINSPEDLAKKPFEQIFVPHKKKIQSLNYIEIFKVKLNDNYQKPTKNKFLLELFDIIALVEYKSKEILLRKITNFTVKEVSNVTHVFNNGTNEKNINYFLLTLQSDKGYIKSDIEVIDSAKSDMNKFQECLSKCDNHFQTAFHSKKEFSTFMEDFVISKMSKNVEIYENSGVIYPQMFLGSDFLIDKGAVYKADKNGLIQLPNSENKFVKAKDDNCFKLPVLYDSPKPASIVVKNFIENIIESWGNNSIAALLIIGHMVMGLFYEKFKNCKAGIPTLVISGVTGCGKTTMVENGMAIFGLDESFLIAGNSTVFGQMSLSQMINGVNVCIDDMAERIIASENFCNLIKSAYKGISRAKRGEAKKTEKRTSCSQCIYSTNSAISDIPEIVNRVNTITIMNNSLDTQKFQYFSENKENRKELSLILPELLKFSEEQVVNLHSQLEEKLKEQIQVNDIPRILSNIAYMWTGLNLLEQIANYRIKDLEAQIFDYAKKIIESYKALETPVDMLLNSLLTLQNLGVISESHHYKVSQEDNKILLQFHKDTLLSAYNNYFREENRKIKPKIFNNYLSNDNRVINKGITGNFNGQRKHSIVIDITGIPDVYEFSGVKPSKYDDNFNEITALLNSPSSSNNK